MNKAETELGDVNQIPEVFSGFQKDLYAAVA